MGFGFGGGYDFNRCDDRRDHHRDHHRKDENNRQVNNNPELLQFLRTLTPGTCIVLQYDCQPPTSATFQGFQGNNVIILSDFDCFPGLARIAINKINVISINSPDCDRFCCKRRRHCKECDEHKHDNGED
ncbi:MULTISPECIES: hypothetical protein [Bacillus cereus group]|uniref:Uncharacterized protein n=3 Tax=Bacillus cereus group TaxID=86661 RepID=A0A9W5K2P7_BACC8|nr:MULTISPECIES: hypothetical protein [Bacillus cereus group]AMR05934.1 hypothetical protein AXW78_28005 [Bacillus thuringiensis]ANC22760.1 hypothetical protein WR52_28980 [Bacillus cereus]AYF85337.1 hypothetical protein D7J84_30640 [Bacillus thuringiensis]EJR13850.1 hypothetical protein IIA_05352 [Bacillus cereus VD014]EJR74658.1 hypothetical protein IK7_05569 [Bacillus cereus VD156]